MVRYIIRCAVTPFVALSLLLAGCAVSTPRPEADASASTTTALSQRNELAPYLEVLAATATGEPAQQQARVDAVLADSQAAPTATNRLRYALALGNAGRSGSNPLEAHQLITELLATPDALREHERALALSFAREFEARMNLSSTVARQNDECEAKLDAEIAHAARRSDALAAENARLKRALADSNRKLKAVAEIEQQLLDQGSDPEPPPPPP
jgi:hypothetical protein